MDLTSTRPRYVALRISDAAQFAGDTISEVVDQLIPGHARMADDEQLAARLDAIADAANLAQSLIVASVSDGTLSEDALSVLLHDRRQEVVDLAEWKSNIPLLLVASGYAPYTTLRVPAGPSVVLLDPATERSFLDALGAVGGVELYIAPGAESGSDAESGES